MVVKQEFSKEISKELKTLFAISRRSKSY